MAVWRLHGMMVPSVMVMLGLASTAACSPSIGVARRRAPKGELSGAWGGVLPVAGAPDAGAASAAKFGIVLPWPEKAMIGAVAGVC